MIYDLEPFALLRRGWIFRSTFPCFASFVFEEQWLQIWPARTDAALES